MQQGGRALANGQFETWVIQAGEGDRHSDHRTDHSGCFDLAVPADQTCELRFSDPRAPAGTQLEIPRLKPGETRDLGTFQLLTSGLWAGRVIGGDGQPVPGAKVSAGFAETSSDANGRFRLTRISPADSSLTVEAQGFVTGIWYDDFRLEPGQEIELGDIRLSRGETITGQVLDPQGNPVAQVQIQLIKNIAFEEDPILATSETNAAGRFLLTAIDKNIFFPTLAHLEVRHADYPTARVPITEAKHYVIRLVEPLSLGGIVRGLESPPHEVTLRRDYRAENRGPRSESWSPGLVPTKPYKNRIETDDEGRFLFENLRAGHYRVDARAKSGRSQARTQHVHLPRSNERLILALIDVGQIELRIEDAEGQPIPQAQWAYYQLSQVRNRTPQQQIESFRQLRHSLEHSGRLISGQTDEDGSAFLHPELDRNLVVEVSAPGFVRQATVLSPGEDPQIVTLTLAAGGRVQGEIEHWLDRTLKYPLNLVLQHEGKQGGEIYVPVDATGTFSKGELDAGRYSYQLSYEAPRISAKISLPVAQVRLVDDFAAVLAGERQRQFVAEGNFALGFGETQELKLSLPTLGTITGLVTDAGIPLPGARVFMKRPGEMNDDFRLESPIAQTDAQGRFRVMHTRPMTLDLRVKHPMGITWSSVQTVAARQLGGTVDARFALDSAALSFAVDRHPSEQSAGLEVRLYPLEQAPIDAHYAGHHSSARAWRIEHSLIAPDGKIQIPGIAAGTWLVRLSQSHHLLAQQIVQFNPGQHLDLGHLNTTHREVTIALPQDIFEQAKQNHQPEAWEFPLEWPQVGVWIRQLDTPTGTKAWFRTLHGSQDGHFQTELPPGQYEAEIFVSRYYNMGIGQSGDSTGQFAHFEVLPGGTISPPQLIFDER